MTAIVHSFKGVSGTWYEFAMSDIPTTTGKGCGVYMFAARGVEGHFRVLYIGRASCFSTRLNDQHEKLLPAQLLGMTTLGQVTCANDRHADIIERDLIAQFNPPLNSLLRSDQ